MAHCPVYGTTSCIGPFIWNVLDTCLWLSCWIKIWKQNPVCQKYLRTKWCHSHSIFGYKTCIPGKPMRNVHTTEKWHFPKHKQSDAREPHAGVVSAGQAKPACPSKADGAPGCSLNSRSCTARARWLRATTLGFYRSLLWVWETSCPVWKATAWETWRRNLVASPSHAPLLSATNGLKQIPWRAQSAAVSRWFILTFAQDKAAAVAALLASARFSGRRDSVTARSRAVESQHKCAGRYQQVPNTIIQ